jgi:hypothetical protein
MTEQTDFLKEAVTAMAASEECDGRNSRQQAMALALLSLAQDVRRLADALEQQAASDYLAESARIYGSAS